MNPGQDSFPREPNSGNLAIMIVILIVILGVVLLVIFLFKPEKKDFNSAQGEIKNTPKEHIEALESSIVKVYNLTNEARLVDALFDELVFTD